MSLRWEEATLSQCTPRDVLDFAKLRTDVFFLEQHINEEEIDTWDADEQTVHLWVRDGETMVGYARIVTRDDPADDDRGVRVSLGRLVVDPAYRSRGIARGLMERALEITGSEPVVLHAQTYIQDFYASLGFEPFGEAFDEAGIDHIRMLRQPTRETP